MRKVEVRIEIKVEPREVIDAFTDPMKLEQWWGVERALMRLRAEIERSMILMGCANISALDRRKIMFPAASSNETVAGGSDGRSDFRVVA